MIKFIILVIMKNALIFLGIVWSTAGFGQSVGGFLSKGADSIYCQVKSRENIDLSCSLEEISGKKDLPDVEKFILFIELAKLSLSQQDDNIAESIFKRLEGLQSCHKYPPRLLNEYILLKARHAIHNQAPVSCLELLQHWNHPALNGRTEDWEIRDDFKAMELKAAAYFQLKENEKAEALIALMYKNANSKAPLAGYRYLTHLNYAAILGENGKHRKSNKLYSAVLEEFHEAKKTLAEDDLSSIYYHMAVNHLRLDNYQKAEKLLDFVLQKDDIQSLPLMIKLFHAYLDKNEYQKAGSILKKYELQLAAAPANNYTDALNWGIAKATLAEKTGDIESYLCITDSIHRTVNNKYYDLKSAALLEIEFLRIKADFYTYLMDKDCYFLQNIHLRVADLIASLTQQKNMLTAPEDIETLSNVSDPVLTFFFETVLESQNTCCDPDLHLVFEVMETYKKSAHLNQRLYTSGGYRKQLRSKLDALKRSIPSDTHVLLYFYCGKKSAYTLILSKNELRFTAVPNIADIISGSRELMSLLEEFVLHKYLRDESWQNEEKIKFQTIGARIYQAFIAPLEVSKYKNWNISPDKGLYAIPVEILISGSVSSVNSWHDLNFLLKSISINYFHSAEQFLRKSHKKHKEKGILSIRQNNADTSGENNASDIQNKEIDFFKTKFKVSERVNDSYLNKKALWEEIKDFKYVHLAMHSQAGENNEPAIDFKNFRLAYEDITREKVDCKMVVMGTCNSSSGVEFKGYGIKSLSHAFSLAGAENTIAMKWEAEDESTASVLERFYSYLDQGWDTPNAMRRAKLDFLNNAGQIKSHPFFWAAGEVYSDFDNLTFEIADNQKVKAWLFFGIPVLFFCLLIGIKKRVTSTFDMTRPNKL